MTKWITVTNSSRQNTFLPLSFSCSATAATAAAATTTTTTTTTTMKHICITILLAVLAYESLAFSSLPLRQRASVSAHKKGSGSVVVQIKDAASDTKLYSNEEGDNEVAQSQLGESEQTLLGVAGFVASITMLYSESVLFQTGCGLPAGPAGLVGAAEGVSYLGVVGLVGYSLFTKIRTVCTCID
jgi:hypothetical protein